MTWQNLFSFSLLPPALMNYCLWAILFCLPLICLGWTEDTTYIADEEDLSYVTYGSLIKLRHESTGFRLHSHEVSYGSGSKQQSVTAVSQPDDVNSFWIIKEAHESNPVPQGTPIRHGDLIRLQHTSTGCNLHSHQHNAPLSSGLEVSCYGKNGEGDQFDNWKVDLPLKKGLWQRGAQMRLQHAKMETYLASHDMAYGRPIAGQHEVKAIPKKRDYLCLWKTEEGIYFEAINDAKSDE